MEDKRVHLVEMRDTLAPGANVQHRPLLLAEIGKYAAVHTGQRALNATDEHVMCAAPGGSEVLIPGKSVICALGQRSRASAVSSLNGVAPFVRVIGGAARVDTITNAVHWGLSRRAGYLMMPIAVEIRIGHSV